MSLSVQFRSGQFEGSPQEMITLVKQLAKNAMIQAGTQIVSEYINHVAQKTGALKAGFVSAVTQEVAQIFTQENIRVDWNEIESRLNAQVDYAKYHIDGKPHHEGDTSLYDNPSKLGTRPIDSREFMKQFNERSQNIFDDLLKTAGINYRRS